MWRTDQQTDGEGVFRSEFGILQSGQMVFDAWIPLWTISLHISKYKIQKIQNINNKIQNTKFKLQNTKYKIQNSIYKIQNMYKTQNSNYKIQNTKCMDWLGSPLAIWPNVAHLVGLPNASEKRGGCNKCRIFNMILI